MPVLSLLWQISIQTRPSATPRLSREFPWVIFMKEGEAKTSNMKIHFVCLSSVPFLGDYLESCGQAKEEEVET